MVPEAQLEPTEHGLVPKGEGWFVLNAREARWYHAEGRSAVCAFAGPCVVVAVGARQHQEGPDWGGYTVDEAALRHGAGVEKETNEPKEAYAPFERRRPARYRDGWLPESL